MPPDSSFPITGVQDVTDQYLAGRPPVPVNPNAGLQFLAQQGYGQPNLEWNGNTLTARQWNPEAVQAMLAGQQPGRTQTLMTETQTPMDPQTIAMRLAGNLAPTPQQKLAAYGIYAKLAPEYTQAAEQENLATNRAALTQQAQQKIDLERQKIGYDTNAQRNLEFILRQGTLQNWPAEQLGRAMRTYEGLIDSSKANEQAPPAPMRPGSPTPGLGLTESPQQAADFLTDLKSHSLDAHGAFSPDQFMSNIWRLRSPAWIEANKGAVTAQVGKDTLKDLSTGGTFGSLIKGTGLLPALLSYPFSSTPLANFRQNWRVPLSESFGSPTDYDARNAFIRQHILGYSR